MWIISLLPLKRGPNRRFPPRLTRDFSRDHSFREDLFRIADRSPGEKSLFIFFIERTNEAENAVRQPLAQLIEVDIFEN
ncbi:hypothetical protein AAG593_04900 [Citromicrobium bathyomarinum]